MAADIKIASLAAAFIDFEESDSSSESDDEFFTSASSLAIAVSRVEKVKVEGYVETIVPLYTLDDFKRFFRMSRHTFEIICEQFGTLQHEFQQAWSGGRTPIPLQKQLLVFLWYVGTLEPLCRIADRFHITEFSVLKIRKKICKLMLRHFKSKYIVWPDGQDRIAVTDAFQDKRGFPGVIGAIDSTHIQITPPKEHPQTYVNRKGYHSIILQCVCREDLRYIHCFAGWPGSCHDSRVVKNSDLWQIGQNLCHPNHLIGDGGYPLKEWLLTPFRDNGHLTRQQQHYNFCLSSTRQVIERSFSLLKGRFRRLQHIDAHSVEVEVELCVSCCILHNICILESEDLGDFFNEEPVRNIPAVALVDNDGAGIQKRNHISQTLP